MRGQWDNGTHHNTPRRGEGMEGRGDMSLWDGGPWWKGKERAGGAWRGSWEDSSPGE